MNCEMLVLISYAPLCARKSNVTPELQKETESIMDAQHIFQSLLPSDILFPLCTGARVAARLINWVNGTGVGGLAKIRDFPDGGILSIGMMVYLIFITPSLLH